MCRSKHVEPVKNFGVVNSITKLHFVGISTEQYTMYRSMSIEVISALHLHALEVKEKSCQKTEFNPYPDNVENMVSF